MAKIIMKGLSQLGRNRVREHGSEWRQTHERVKGMNDSLRSLESVETGHRRWVLTDGTDPDFEVTQNDTDTDSTS